MCRSFAVVSLLLCALAMLGTSDAALAQSGAAQPAGRFATRAAQERLAVDASGPAAPAPVERSIELAGVDLAAVSAYLHTGDRWLTQSLVADVLGDGRQYVVLAGTARRCGSCHAHWIAVWDVERQAVLWETADGRDTHILPSALGSGFILVDNAPAPDDPSCCPSARVERFLTWDGAEFREQ